MMDSSTDQVVKSFFAAMNAQDADSAAALVDASVEIALGSHVFRGREAVRELAVQQDAQLAFEFVPVTVERDGDRVDVVARRVQRWRDGGEIAAEEDVRVHFVLGPAGLITRVELS
jgi:hypothetical protein